MELDDNEIIFVCNNELDLISCVFQRYSILLDSPI